MTKIKLNELAIKNQRVLMRVDFNVPLNDDGSISDDSRIQAALPSIRYVLEQGGSLILMSHLGRPQGKRDAKATLAPCAKRLSELLKQPVPLAPDCVGADTEALVRKMKSREVLLLENVRFHPGEEDPEKEPEFVEELAKLGDVYVNDAFGTAHRPHASTALIARFFPQKAAMGFLIEQELAHLSPLLHHPKRPFYAIIGGAKVSSKAGVVKKILDKLDSLFIGGGMAFPFLKAAGVPIGRSLCEEKDVLVAQEIVKEAKKRHVPLHLPLDLVAIKEEGAPSLFTDGLPDGWAGMDIGPQTIEQWAAAFQEAKTIFWNGPVGVFEKSPFDQGTRGVAEALARCKAEVIVGGGDSVAAVQQMGLGASFSHLSTGGGAALEYLEFGRLPGIDALSDK